MMPLKWSKRSKKCYSRTSLLEPNESNEKREMVRKKEKEGEERGLEKQGETWEEEGNGEGDVGRE